MGEERGRELTFMSAKYQALIEILCRNDLISDS